MPKAKSKTRPHNERSRGISRSSPRGSVQASSAASHSLASTRMQLNESEAVPSPSPVAAEVSASQGMPVESLLPSQLLETLVAKVADEVSRRFAAVLPAQPTTPGSSQLTEVAVCSSSNTPQSTFASPPTNGSAPIRSSASPEDMASSVVQQSVANAAHSLTGLAVQAPLETPGQLFQSAGLPVDARVSEKLRAKIWSNEYIDFGSLLTNPAFENQYRLTFQGADSGPVPSLCLEPVSKPKKLQSVESWLHSFHVFVAIYTKKFPHEAPALMKYGEIIQDLAGRGHNWKFYDENFRFLRQAHHTSMPWDRIQGELWLKSQAFVKPLPPNIPPMSSQPKLDSIPRGYCFRFHKDKKCNPGCAYNHNCFKCEGSHPVTKCNFRGPSKQSRPRPLPANSFPNKPSNTNKS